MTNELEVKERVQRLLADIIGTVEIDPKAGHFKFMFQSAQVYVGVAPMNDKGNVVVRVWSITNVALQPSLELFQYIATRDYVFGAPRLIPQQDGTFTVVFGHAILGDTLDPEELRTALYAVMAAAETLDDEIKSKFGGERWTDG